ncbi:hypothetical protein [Alteromonas lipotrueae]|uniref:hypothetical protein n=1 Tax=Alteromonas lipotrueae TaxID=2803814 RepID=UPI001C452C93|nr:hypothetical protein [Alteromonas lipotrueae]
MRFFVFIIFFSLFIQAAMANEETPTTKIKILQSWAGDNAFYIWTDEQAKLNPANCNYSGSYYLPASASESTKSMIISAAMSKANVKFVLYSEGCQQNRPQVVAVKIIGD